MNPEVDIDLGIAMGVTPETVKKSLHQHPDAKGVLIYQSDLLRRRHRPEKNCRDRPSLQYTGGGGRSPTVRTSRFSSKLPLQALDAGADICAQSTHKIVGAMTQCSMVHCREGRINVPRLRSMLQLVQSTSPNYILMASLDVARMQLAAEGRELVAPGGGVVDLG